MINCFSTQMLLTMTVALKMPGKSDFICSFLARSTTSVTLDGLLYHCAASALHCNETDHEHRLCFLVFVYRRVFLPLLEPSPLTCLPMFA